MAPEKREQANCPIGAGGWGYREKSRPAGVITIRNEDLARRLHASALMYCI